MKINNSNKKYNFKNENQFYRKVKEVGKIFKPLRTSKINKKNRRRYC